MQTSVPHGEIGKDQDVCHRSAVVTALLTVSLVAVTLNALWGSYRSFGEFSDVHLEVEALSGEIRYLDEVLTMSTEMATATGAQRWKARYDGHAIRLDEALAEFKGMGMAGVTQHSVEQIAEANDALVGLEERAFALVGTGDLAAARDLIHSDYYGEQKTIYGAGIRQILGAAQGEVRRAVTSSTRHLVLHGVVFLVLVLVLNLAWVRLARDMRRRRSALTQATMDVEEARQSANHADSAKARFLGTMSHELRTPLHAITGFTEVLQGDQRGGGELEADARAEALRSIEGAAEELDQWIAQALRLTDGQGQYASPGKDQPTVNFAPAPVCERVLVVDDVALNRRLMERMLEQLQLAAASAENGAVALEVVAACTSDGEGFDAILMDLDMPVMDGRTAARELRERGFGGRIIAFTANVTARVMEEPDSPFDAQLPKPVDRSTLRELLHAS